MLDRAEGAPGPMSSHDAELYARSFVDVYDAWYGELDDPGLVVGAFERRRPPPATIVEFGGGTGRLARPLSDAGFHTISVDVSVPMLRRTGPGPIALACDMADVALRAGSADLVLIAYNTLFNLADRALQQRCLAEAGRILRPGGLLAVEAFIAAPRRIDEAGDDSFGITIRPHPTEQEGWLAILTATEVEDPSVIVGSHVELRVDATICRPWRLAYQSPAELDQSAEAAGFVLLDRHGGWDDEPLASDARRHVSWYHNRSGVPIRAGLPLP